ncbi:alpha/beta hydrolase [Mycolicibacterium setense]
MRDYDDRALKRLLHVAEYVEINGSNVELKRSVSELRPGLLDPWVLRYEAAARTDLPRSVRRVEGPRTLLRLLFRPASMFVDLRNLGDTLLAEVGERTRDLTSQSVSIAYEDLVLWRNLNRLWRYEGNWTSNEMRPAFLHLHGGGFFAGRPAGRDPLLKFIADRSGAVVFDLDYSLSPEYKFPHAVNEVYAAIEHLYRHADRYGIDRQRIVVGGGSAGGNLTAAAMLKARDQGGPHVARQVLINPALLLGSSRPRGFRWCKEDYDIARQTRKLTGKMKDPARSVPMAAMSKVYRGAEHADNPLLSPLLAADLGGVPAALIFTAEMDPLRSEAEFYAGQLAAAGVPVRTIRYMGTTHTTPALFGHAPQAEAIALEIVAALSTIPLDSGHEKKTADESR